MFILCDRWFPGSLAVGIAPCRHLVFVVGFCSICFVFSFALMEPIIALPQVAGLCDRVPTNRNGSAGQRGGDIGLQFSCLSRERILLDICKNTFAFID